MGVVVILKLLQLLFKIMPVPEKKLVKVFASDCADKSLGKGMGYRHMGNGFDFLDLSYPQIGPPR